MENPDARQPDPNDPVWAATAGEAAGEHDVTRAQIIGALDAARRNLERVKRQYGVTVEATFELAVRLDHTISMLFGVGDVPQRLMYDRLFAERLAAEVDAMEAQIRRSGGTAKGPGSGLIVPGGNGNGRRRH